MVLFFSSLLHCATLGITVDVCVCVYCVFVSRILVEVEMNFSPSLSKRIEFRAVLWLAVCGGGSLSAAAEMYCWEYLVGEALGDGRQLVLEYPEAGPVLGTVGPALFHHIVDLLGARFWFL